MPRASDARDVLARPAPTRIFVALTLAEAAGIVARQPGTDVDAVRGFLKIAAALDGATSVLAEPAPLRAKHYSPQTSPVPSVAVAPAPPRRQSPPSSTPPLDDAYVPYRDEAAGLWK